MLQQKLENNFHDVVLTASNKESVCKRHSKNYKTTGEDGYASTNTSGTTVPDEEANPAPNPSPANTKLLHDCRIFIHYVSFFN